MRDATISFDNLDDALTSAAPTLSDNEQRLAVATYRMLATGEPVSVDAAAAATGAKAEDVDRTLRSWPGVFRDNAGAVIGFWGLALAEMSHRLRVAGVELFAWCAWDPLFLARIIGPMRVATEDPLTGETINYQIDDMAAIRDLTHPQTVLSFLRPDRPWGDDVRVTFCHYVRQFTNPDSARRWTSQHPDTFTLSQADGIELARRHVARTFGSALVRQS